MAIWQFRLVLIPEEILLSKYDVLPLTIPQDLAEDFPWWSAFQPPVGFEKSIDMILPPTPSWSTSMRMWGEKHGDEAYVGYVDDSKTKVEDIAFHIDVRTLSRDFVHRICQIAKHLGCVLLSADYEIFAPDESMVLTAISKSTAKRYLEDPVSTLRGLDQKKFEYFAKPDREDLPPKS